MAEILDYFPFDMYDPRVSQKNIILQIEKAIKQGFKFIIIQAPTGVGKSVISLATGRSFDGAYICTSQKYLQNQYTEEFPEVKKVRGRNTFFCLESTPLTDIKGNTSYALTCDIGERK